MVTDRVADDQVEAGGICADAGPGDGILSVRDPAIATVGGLDEVGLSSNGESKRGEEDFEHSEGVKLTREGVGGCGCGYVG